MNTSVALILIAAVGIITTNAKIRRCRCDEEHVCRKAALDSADECAQKCGIELKPFGNNIVAMVQCFGEQRSLIAEEEACLKKKIGASCENSNRTTYIKKFDFATLEVKFEPPKRPSGGAVVQTSYDSLITFKKYHYCIRKCMKDVAVSCYGNKGCGIQIPSLGTVSEWVEECAASHPQFYARQLQACHCMLYKLHVSKLAGVCVHVGNPLQNAHHY